MSFNIKIADRAGKDYGTLTGVAGTTAISTLKKMIVKSNSALSKFINFIVLLKIV